MVSACAVPIYTLLVQCSYSAKDERFSTWRLPNRSAKYRFGPYELQKCADCHSSWEQLCYNMSEPCLTRPGACNKHHLELM